MLLAELSELSGVSPASIKYYRREGLLPPGERVTATRQDYGRRHLERLALIQVLREVAGAPISRIAGLTAILDAPERPLIDALAAAQLIALDLPEEPSCGAEQAEQAEHPTIVPLLERLGWPDADSAPRRALDELLRSLEGWGMPTDLELVHRYAAPMATIARADVESIRRLGTERSAPSDSPAQSTEAGGSGSADDPAHDPADDGMVSDDVQVMRAVAGAIAFDRLVQLLRALGHTSYSMLSAADRSRTRDGSAPPHAG